MPKKGLFVTLEGPDGAGKSTQRRLLAAALRKARFVVVETREPGGSKLAEVIRELVLNPKHRGLTDRTELLLFEAARAQHVADTIVPALAKGKVVLCDRFTDSTVAYQGAGRALKRGEVAWLNRFATAGLKPHLTLVYDRDAAEGVRRSKHASGKADRMEKAGQSFHARVRAAFKRMAAAEPRRIKRIVVDGKTPKSVADEGLALILKKLR